MRDCGNIKFLLPDPHSVSVEISRYQQCPGILSPSPSCARLQQTDRQRARQSKLIKSDNFQCFIGRSWQSLIGEHMKTLNLPFVLTTPDSLLHILYSQPYCVLDLHEIYWLCKLTTIDNRWYQSGALYLILYLPFLSILTCIYLE